MRVNPGIELGEPSLALGPFSLWVHRREFPSSHDKWDGNWLVVTAECSGAPTVNGPYLDTVSFSVFRGDLDKVYRERRGYALLGSLEPDVSVEVSTGKSPSVFDVEVFLGNPEDAGIQFEVDREALPFVVAQCDAVLKAFPVVEPQARGV